MPNYSKVERSTAEDADWSFCTPDILDQLRAVAEFHCRRNGDLMLDVDDIVQDLVLYLAVRPEDTDTTTHLMGAARRHAFEIVRQAATEQEREVLSLDAGWDTADDAEL